MRATEFSPAATLLQFKQVSPPPSSNVIQSGRQHTQQQVDPVIAAPLERLKVAALKCSSIGPAKSTPRACVRPRAAASMRAEAPLVEPNGHQRRSLGRSEIKSGPKVEKMGVAPGGTRRRPKSGGQSCSAAAASTMSRAAHQKRDD